MSPVLFLLCVFIDGSVGAKLLQVKKEKKPQLSAPDRSLNKTEAASAQALVLDAIMTRGMEEEEGGYEEGSSGISRIWFSEKLSFSTLSRPPF